MIEGGDFKALYFLQKEISKMLSKLITSLTKD